MGKESQNYLMKVLLCAIERNFIEIWVRIPLESAYGAWWSVTLQ